MKRSKRDPASDEFGAFLIAAHRNVRQCETCRSGGAALEMIARYVERARAGEAVPMASVLHDYLTEKAGYRLGYSAMMGHVRKCLGYLARAR